MYIETIIDHNEGALYIYARRRTDDDSRLWLTIGDESIEDDSSSSIPLDRATARTIAAQLLAWAEEKG